MLGARMLVHRPTRWRDRAYGVYHWVGRLATGSANNNYVVLVSFQGGEPMSSHSAA